MKKLLFLTFISFLIISFTNDNQRLYDYEFTTLNEETITYSQIINDSPKTVLFFWTSWCYYCRNELKRTNKNPVQIEDVKFYYINLGETEKIMRHVVENLKLDNFITENMVLDKQGFFANKFNIIGLPTYIFLKDGEVKYRANFINNGLIEKIFNNE